MQFNFTLKTFLTFHTFFLNVADSVSLRGSVSRIQPSNSAEHWGNRQLQVIGEPILPINEPEWKEQLERLENADHFKKLLEFCVFDEEENSSSSTTSSPISSIVTFKPSSSPTSKPDLISCKALEKDVIFLLKIIFVGVLSMVVYSAICKFLAECKRESSIRNNSNSNNCIALSSSTLFRRGAQTQTVYGTEPSQQFVVFSEAGQRELNY